MLPVLAVEVDVEVADDVASVDIPPVAVADEPAVTGTRGVVVGAKKAVGDDDSSRTVLGLFCDKLVYRALAATPSGATAHAGLEPYSSPVPVCQPTWKKRTAGSWLLNTCFTKAVSRVSEPSLFHDTVDASIRDSSTSQPVDSPGLRQE